jgi:hypothetical protein
VVDLIQGEHPWTKLRLPLNGEILNQLSTVSRR